MIDEKKLIEDIKECYTEEFLAEYGFDKLVEAQPKVGEWIPCSERLPDYKDPLFHRSDKVIVSVKDDEGVVFCTIGWYRFGGDWCHVGRRGTVIAWMPPPQPYKEEVG